MTAPSPRQLLPTFTRATALFGALVTLLAGTWVLWTAVVQSSGAPLAWRLHLLLLEALPLLCLLTGFVLTTIGSTRIRRLGWSVVGTTLVSTLLWGAFAASPHPIPASLPSAAQ